MFCIWYSYRFQTGNEMILSIRYVPPGGYFKVNLNLTGWCKVFIFNCIVFIPLFHHLSTYFRSKGGLNLNFMKKIYKVSSDHIQREITHTKGGNKISSWFLSEQNKLWKQVYELISVNFSAVWYSLQREIKVSTISWQVLCNRIEF